MKIANVAVVLVAVVHFGLAGGEMFFWANLDRVHKDLHLSPDQVVGAAHIVANAGLYNLFIASGLVWSVAATVDSRSKKLFFLSCVAVAGIFGAKTLSPITLLLQTLPAVIAAFLVWRPTPTTR